MLSNVTKVINNCFLCEYSGFSYDNFICENSLLYCPGKWGNYSLIHDFEDELICVQGEYGFYENRCNFSEDVLKRVYLRIANICE
jgi:hypothetical protein